MHHLPVQLALELKEAGLLWQPVLHDFFALPDVDVDHPFVLTNMMANLEVLKGFPAITFNGAAEWAMDYVFTVDVVWLPTETQLRQLVASRVREVVLRQSADSYHCSILLSEQPLGFSADNASTAYARALLHCLRRERDEL